MSKDWKLYNNGKSDETGDTWYHEVIIETLRQKLIVDIGHLVDSIDADGYEPDYKSIINKRFGVDE